MNRTMAFIVAAGFAHQATAAAIQDIYQEPLSALAPFAMVQSSLTSKGTLAKATVAEDALRQLSSTTLPEGLLVRYQQYFRGIPVVGAQVVVAKADIANQARASGMLVNALSLDTTPAISADDALRRSKEAWFAGKNSASISAIQSTLQIRMKDETTPQLTWLVAFRTPESMPRIVMDAKTGEIIHVWNNLQKINESGPGGNERVGRYWYGKDGAPALVMPQSGTQCTMDNALVRLVRLHSEWDWDGKLVSPYVYPCGTNTDDAVNGAYSPGNDAYFFANTVVSMYKAWYGLNALQKPDGSFMQLVTRVHFGEAYDNAFWDGQTLTFGDGDALFPLTSLDVVGHEATHGFTEHHAGLEYHDQSGALNESMSDMAGIASRAFLLNTNRAFYNKTELNPDAVTWTIGQTIMRGSKTTAMRYMDQPSKDGDSADCVDQKLAQKAGEKCSITWSKLMMKARIYYPDPEQRQSYIVHTASGIYNKAFYLLSKAAGIKSAYQVMLRANMLYWTPTSDFANAACGVRRAANDLKLNAQAVKTVFDKVGIETTTCKI